MQPQPGPRRSGGLPGAVPGLVGGLLALVTLTACSGPPRQAAAPPATTAAASTPTQSQAAGQGGTVPDPTVTAGTVTGGTVTGSTVTARSGGGAGGGLVLAPDGIGVARFGQAPNRVIAAVSRQLGAPRRDSGWKPRGAIYGVCPGTRTRAVTWGQFTALFSDGPTNHGPAGREHFFLWSVQGTSRTTPVATAAGVGVGSTLAELRRAYGRQLQTWEPNLPGSLPGFGVGPRYRFSLAGSLSDGRVRHLQAGTSCGE